MFGLDDKPPFRQAVLVALQHVLAVFAGIIAPPLLISKSLGLPAADSTFLVNMALFVSGVGTVLQTLGVGRIGSRLLSVQGTSFVFVGPIIALASSAMAQGVSRNDALGIVFGVCLAASLVPILISPFIQAASRMMPPLVTGTVVTLIGLSLIEVGMTSLGGGFGAKQDGTFGSPSNLFLGGLVLSIILLLGSHKAPWPRMLAIVAGLSAGYLAAGMIGGVNLTQLRALPWFAAPIPLHYGIGFRVSALIPFAFLYLVTAIESIGDLTATASLTAQPITGPLYFRRLSGGVLADGITSLLAATCNSFPSTTFAQNNAVIQLTGVGSPYVGAFAGVILIVLGSFPAVGAIVQAMPQPVLGGMTILMFGTVAVAGIKILSRVDMDRRASTIVAISLGFGLGVTYVPGVLGALPAMLQSTFSSGIATGGLCALFLNAVLPGKTAFALDRDGS